VSSRAGSKGTWLFALPVLVVLLWTVVYQNASIIVGSFEHGLRSWR